jgi:hypothetical protein
MFAGCVERLAVAFLAEPSNDTLFNILALPKAGLAPELKQGLKTRLERYPRVDWPRPEPSDGTTPRTTTAVKDVEKGRLGSAARRLAGTAAVATVDDEVVATLRDKHPAGAEDPFGPTDGPSSGDIPSEEEIMAAFKTFKPDTSPGLSGWTHHLLATALRVPAFLKAIHTLTGLIVAGTAPGQAMLCASRLTPLRKPDGGLRPIAVGDENVEQGGMGSLRMVLRQGEEREEPLGMDGNEQVRSVWKHDDDPGMLERHEVLHPKIKGAKLALGGRHAWETHIGENTPEKSLTCCVTSPTSDSFGT